MNVINLNNTSELSDIAAESAKSVQRRSFLELRRAIPAEERSRQSIKICGILTELPQYKTAKSIFMYLSVRSEAETDYILSDALKKGKRVSVPLCIFKGEIFKGKQFEENVMLPIEITSEKQLEYGAYHIREPKRHLADNGSLKILENTELAVIPGVAFDKNCSRMGMGGGYYDRYLSNYKGFKVGLAYTQCIAEKIITDSFDRAMDAVVHPGGIIWHNK